MFLKVVGVDKASKELGKVSKVTKQLDDDVNKSGKKNAKYAAGMSGLQKTAVAGGAIFAAKALMDFSKAALEAGVTAAESAAAFKTTFGEAENVVTNFLENFANKAGLTIAEAQQLTAVMGSVAQGLGMTQHEAARLSIEMTKIAGDIASFMNVSGGTEQVLRAMQSALVGEFESMKTYGAVLSATEVQQVAFNNTGKQSVDQLTRLDKAWATLSLIQDKAKVQIGDLDRTFTSLANQSRAFSAEIRQLKEDIGTALIPAAEALLPLMRDMVDIVTPILIDKFSSAADSVVDWALAMEYANRVGFENFKLMKLGGRQVEDIAEEQRKYRDIIDRTTDKQIVANIQQALHNQLISRQRSLWTVVLPQTKKYGKSLEKDVIPQVKKLALFLGLTNTEIDKITGLTEDYEEAQKDFNRVAEQEALVSAQEILRKKELQDEIKELLFWQEKGIDVAAELAVKEEELKLVEKDILRESDALIDSRDRLTQAQKKLADATSETEQSFQEQLERQGQLAEALAEFDGQPFIDEAIRIADALNLNVAEAIENVIKAYRDYRQEFTGKTLTEELALQLPSLAGLGLPGAVATTPVPVATTSTIDTGVSSSGSNNKSGTIDLNINLSDALGEIIQRENIQIQERGDTFVLGAE
jgi:hypothetical protein